MMSWLESGKELKVFMGRHGREAYQELESGKELKVIHPKITIHPFNLIWNPERN